jgi:threonine dehydratase
MPEDAMPLKVSATARWGTEIEFAGVTSLDRQLRAEDLIAKHGYSVVPPFDDVRIIAGQGTCGLEIVDQLPEVEAVVVPVGGGGLISGVVTAIKSLRPSVMVVGVEPAGAADARDSLRQGRIVTWERVDTVSDGLRTSRIGELNFRTMSELLDDIVTVSEEEILQTVAILVESARLVAEPSGATAPAAVLFGKAGLKDSKVVAILSGGNVEPSRLISCLEVSTGARA